MCFQLFRHTATARDDESAVACAGGSLEHPILVGGRHQVFVADIVAVEALFVDLEDASNKLGSLFFHRMDVELHEEVLARLLPPHVAHRQIDQEVVVGFSHLQETLTTLNILHKVGGITPDAVCGAHVHTSIEFPSWPWVVFRRVASTVEKHVVDAAGEHQVHVGLHL